VNVPFIINVNVEDFYTRLIAALFPNALTSVKANRAQWMPRFCTVN
jgi:hypothetical protein